MLKIVWEIVIWEEIVMFKVNWIMNYSLYLFQIIFSEFGICHQIVSIQGSKYALFLLQNIIYTG